MATPARLGWLLRQPRRTECVYVACRSFSCTPASSAGHNKWSKIRHHKGKNDHSKSLARQFLGKEISNAVQLWGPDPKFNPRLGLALSNAKRASVPKDVIAAAIARGQGLSVTGKALEKVTTGAMLPGSVAAVIECQTETTGEYVKNLRSWLNNHGAKMTPTTHLFEKKGKVVMEKKDNINPDDYLDQAIEAGALDITAEEEGHLVLFTDPSETKSVGEAFEKLSGVAIKGIDIFWDPNKDTLVTSVHSDAAEELIPLLSSLGSYRDIQEIYLNLEDCNDLEQFLSN